MRRPVFKNVRRVVQYGGEWEEVYSRDPEKLKRFVEALADGEIAIEGEVRRASGERRIERVPAKLWKTERWRLWRGGDVSNRLQEFDAKGKLVRTYFNPTVVDPTKAVGATKLAED